MDQHLGPNALEDEAHQPGLRAGRKIPAERSEISQHQNTRGFQGLPVGSHTS